MSFLTQFPIAVDLDQWQKLALQALRKHFLLDVIGLGQEIRSWLWLKENQHCFSMGHLCQW